MPRIILATLLILITLSPAHAIPENYEDCRLITTTYSNPGTRLITGPNGFTHYVSAPAWKSKTYYNCARKGEIENLCAKIESLSIAGSEPAKCSKFGQSCIERSDGLNNNGNCERNIHRYYCYVDLNHTFAKDAPASTWGTIHQIDQFPEVRAIRESGAINTQVWLQGRTGGPHHGRYGTWRFTSEGRVSRGRQRLSNAESLWTLSTYELGQVCPQATNPNCTQIQGSFKIVNATPPPGKENTPRYGWTINAPYVTNNLNLVQYAQKAWNSEVSYSCAADDFIDDCGELEADINCIRQSKECFNHDDEGECTNYEYEYKCGQDTAGETTQSCGTVNWCINDDCSDVDFQPEPNQAFGEAAMGMSVLQEIAKDFEPVGVDSITIFNGNLAHCAKTFLNLKNCCKKSGLAFSVGLGSCSEGEKLLRIKRQAEQARYLNTRCSKKSLFGCTEKREYYCTFNSKLARIIHEQGRAQLGIDWSSCRGFTVEEIEMIDWTKIDLTAILGDIEGRLTAQEAADVQVKVTKQVNSFYKGLQDDLEDYSDNTDTETTTETSPDTSTTTGGDDES